MILSQDLLFSLEKRIKFDDKSKYAKCVLRNEVVADFLEPGTMTCLPLSTKSLGYFWLFFPLSFMSINRYPLQKINLNISDSLVHVCKSGRKRSLSQTLSCTNQY